MLAFLRVVLPKDWKQPFVAEGFERAPITDCSKFLGQRVRGQEPRQRLYVM